jgi:(2Fe-2S) ferredoxin
VLLALAKENAKENFNIQLSQTGCCGDCSIEPAVDVLIPGKDKITHTKVTPEQAVEILRTAAISC